MRFVRTTAATVLLILASCSSSTTPSGGPDTTSPGIVSVLQDRSVDSSGRRIRVTFSEPVSATAENAALYTFSGGLSVLSATRRVGNEVVDLDLDDPAVPGVNVLTIAPGIEDSAGNVFPGAPAQAIESSDETAPMATGVIAAAPSGPENDTLVVAFDDDMLASDVETAANWNVEVPLGTGFDVTGATIAYDVPTRTARLTLGAGSADQNLPVLEDVHVALSSVRDLGGNAIVPMTLGSTALTAVVEGDHVAPAALVAAPGVGSTVVVTFTEEVRGLETLDLMAITNPAGTEFTLTDASDPGTPATGSIAITGTPADSDSVTVSDGSSTLTYEFDYATGTVTLSGLPNDGDSVTLDDNVNPSTFEFDSNGSLIGPNVSVTIGADVATTVTALIDAVNADSIQMYAEEGTSSAQMRLTSLGAGSGLNIPLGENDTAGVIALAGMAGGGASGDFAVNVNPTSPSGTAAILRAFIDGSLPGLTLADGASPEQFLLTNNTPGSDGNGAIGVVNAAGAITVSGMAGGVDTGTATHEPTASTAAMGGLQASVTFPVVPAAGDTLRIYGVRDLAGNQMVPELSKTVAASDPAEPGLGTPVPFLANPAGDLNDFALVFFDRDVHPTRVIESAQYSLEDTSGPIDIADSTITMSSSGSIRISFGPDVNLQASETYTLTAEGLVSLQGVEQTLIQTAPGLPATGDTGPPTLGPGSLRLDPSTANAVLATFDEPLEVTGASDPSNYTIAGSQAVAAEFVHPRVVRITFATQPLVSDTLEVAVAALTDIAGNQASSLASVAITAADTTAPTISVLSPSNANGTHEFSFTFDEPIHLSQATDPENYAVTLDGVALSLASASVTRDTFANRVTFTFPAGTYLTQGAPVSVTPMNITDSAGNMIASVPTTGVASGDSTPPTVVSSFINLISDAAGLVVEVTFNEAMDTAETLQAANWSGSGGQFAVSVTQRSATTFQVLFDAPIAPADTVSLLTPTDAPGNQGATLTFDPAE